MKLSFEFLVGCSWCIMIHEFVEIEISELSEFQLSQLEKKMMQSNKKLPLFIAQNLLLDSKDHHIIDTLKTRYEYPEMDRHTASEILLDFIMDYYPSTKITYLVRICRAFLCHKVATYLETLLRGFFDEEENFPNEVCVQNRFFFGLSQAKSTDTNYI